MNDDHMFFQLSGRSKRFTAVLARVWLVARMSALMYLQRRQSIKAIPAGLATESPFSRMHQFVASQLRRVAKRPGAGFADIWTFVGMNVSVSFQASCSL